MCGGVWCVRVAQGKLERIIFSYTVCQRPRKARPSSDPTWAAPYPSEVHIFHPHSCLVVNGHGAFSAYTRPYGGCRAVELLSFRARLQHRYAPVRLPCPLLHSPCSPLRRIRFPTCHECTHMSSTSICGGFPATLTPYNWRPPSNPQTRSLRRGLYSCRHLLYLRFKRNRSPGWE